jgi:hypothetical protein
MPVEPIARVEELRAATELYLAKRQGMTLREKEDAWLDWLERRGTKLVKDAVSFGKWGIVLDTPYQPKGDAERAALKAFGRRVKPLFPGCAMWINEEEAEEEGGAIVYTMELSWAPATAAAAAVESVKTHTLNKEDAGSQTNTPCDSSTPI